MIHGSCNICPSSHGFGFLDKVQALVIISADLDADVVYSPQVSTRQSDFLMLVEVKRAVTEIGRDLICIADSMNEMFEGRRWQHAQRKDMKGSHLRL